MRPLKFIPTHRLVLTLVVLAAGCSGTDDSPGSSSPGRGGAAGGQATGGSPASGAGGSGTGGASATGGSGAGGTTASGGSGGGQAPGSGGTAGMPSDGPTATDGVADAVGAGGDAPSNPAGCSAKFCDDFEGFAVGGPPGGDWKAALAKGALAVDDKKAFSGARSVRFTHQGAPAKMFIELRQPVLPLPGHVMHGRLMYYLTQGPTGQYTHWELVRGGGPLPGGARAQFNTGGENGKVVVNYEPGDCTKYSKIVFPEKKWACYQWEFNGPRNEIKLWVDGQAVTDVPVAPAGQCWKAPTAFDTVHIGWESYHGNTPVEIWVDDVAVGDQPIPCPTGPASKP